LNKKVRLITKNNIIEIIKTLIFNAFLLKGIKLSLSVISYYCHKKRQISLINFADIITLDAEFVKFF